MKRYLEKDIKIALKDKIVLLTGPRQSGKTTLAKQIYKEIDYFNYDAVEDRLALQKKSWDRQKHLIIFDEFHKMKDWKRWLKGIYDKEGVSPEIIVTGSAKLDTYKKMGDSLAGRYFHYRLSPFDLKEIAKYNNAILPEEAYDRLMHCGGFPEPFLKGNETYYKRWRRSHLEIILRQDLLDIQAIKDIQAIETLVHLLKTRVGSRTSYANLANDLQRDINTIKRWLLLLENLYVIFKITPYHKNIARSLLKEPKYYFFDIAQAEGNDHGARLENLVALSLLKELQFLEDTRGIKTSLHYLRTKDGKEIDFLICKDNKPTHVIEVKYSNEQPHPAFNNFMPFLPSQIKKIQLVKECNKETTYPNGLEIRKLIPWLTHFDLN